MNTHRFEEARLPKTKKVTFRPSDHRKKITDHNKNKTGKKISSVTKRLHRDTHFLHVLKDAKTPFRKLLLKHATRSHLLTLTECIINVLAGNAKISDCVKRKLSRHKRYLREISSPSTSWGRRRNILIQRGGFISLIVSTILGSLLGKLLNSNK